MTAVRFALLELRRFRGRPLRYLALVTIVALPLLYGTLQLWSDWDSGDALRRVPVAVVNADDGTVVDGHHVNAGTRLARQLDADDTLDWRITDGADAEDGLESGTYAFRVAIPADFSAGLVPGAPVGADSTITVAYDRSHGDDADRIADAIRERLHRHVDTAVYATVAAAAVPDLDRHGAALRHVRDTSSALTGETGDAAADAAGLAEDLASLEAASRSVADGLGRMNTPVQNAYAVLLDDLDGLAEGTSAAAGLTETAAAELGDIHAALCRDRDDETCARLDEIAAAAVAAAPAATEADDIVSGMTGDDIGRNAAQTDRLADGAAALADDTAAARRSADRLAAATDELDTAVTDVAASVDVVAATFPSSDPAADTARADALVGTVAVADPDDRDTGGRALAPYVIALALWVFALLAYMVLRTVNPRALAGDVAATTVAVAGWLPSALLGVVGALGLYASLDVVLGLSSANVVGTVGLCVLAVAVFCAIAHALRLAFPAAGDVIMVVLLMLQLTSVNGIYPLSTAPGFFRFVSPYLPMTYLVDGLRVTIGGGSGSPWRDAAVLAGFGVLAVAASTVTVMRRRRWTIARLHPAID